MRLLPCLLFLPAAAHAAPALAQDPFWMPDSGVSVCNSTCSGDLPKCAMVGDGGAYVAWQDNSGGRSDIDLQRFTPGGSVADGWPLEGLSVTDLPGFEDLSDMMPDGHGGVLLAWTDSRTPLENRDIYAQRILANGSLAPGWPVNGVLVAGATRLQDDVVLAGDGNGGAFLAWEDDRDGLTLGYPRIFCSYITATGQLAPGWTANGIPASPYFGFNPLILASPLGGFIVVWPGTGAAPLGGSAPELFAQHFSEDGTRAPGWPEEGVLLAIDRAPQGPLVFDGGDGFYFGTATLLETFGHDVYRVHRVQFDGTVAPGWPEDGVVICDAPSDRFQLRLASDGMGGVLAVWYDYRDEFVSGTDLYALRILPDGSIAPGWTANGTRVGDPAGSTFDVHIAPDGSGGAYVVWEQEGPPNHGWIQHLTATGEVAEGWLPEGVRVSTSFAQFCPALASDGMGGALIAWDEAHPPRVGVYAQRFAANDVVSTRPTYLSAEADASGVHVVWFAKDARLLESSVYRRTERSAWTYLGAPEITGPDELRYDDPNVTPGERYAYRLGYFDGATEAFTDEVWVEAATPLAFALDGFRPNPAVGLPIVSLALAKSEPARLEVFDLRGRLVLRRDLSGLGAGRHTVPLEGGVHLAPGVYILRLTQGDQEAHVRGVVLR